jgi:L-galactose dehydrogenase/L-glyceraldehyde 3-phosphate reductase
MEFRVLGSTGISVSAISFGAGPVPALMTNAGQADRQRETIRRAIEAGINWFDTAATYGDGESERSLGAALRKLGVLSRVHVATKVRVMPDQLGRIKENVKGSVYASLRRLQLGRITMIQLHNAITRHRGDQFTSITVNDVLGADGVLAAFRDLKAEGLVGHFGLTGLGDMKALTEVIRCGEFEAVQVCYNILNPSAAGRVPRGFEGEDYGGIIGTCAERKMGVIAIRVFAGGALAGQPPSAHTMKTRFFPLELYQRDLQRAARLAERLPSGMSLREAAVRFVLKNPDISTALVGFSSAEQVAEVVAFSRRGALPDALLS